MDESGGDLESDGQKKNLNPKLMLRMIRVKIKFDCFIVDNYLSSIISQGGQVSMVLLEADAKRQS